MMKAFSLDEENEWRLVSFPLLTSDAEQRIEKKSLIPYWDDKIDLNRH
jgi:hypothetical protein